MSARVLSSQRTIRTCGHATSRQRLVVKATTADGPEPQILVTGSTGGTGKALVEKLTSQGLAVAATSRSLAKARATLPPTVSVTECDLFDFEAVRKAVAGKETVFICSGTTARGDPFDPLKVDWQGVENIVSASKQTKTVKKLIMVSSIGVDDPFFPLNLIGGVLWMKKLGELAVQRSGIDYTILRPGGLRSDDKTDGKTRNVVVGKANTFGLPPRPKLPGGIRRTTVAEACFEAMCLPEVSRNKVVELIEQEDAPFMTWSELFSSVPVN